MDNLKEKNDVPFVVFESVQARQERCIKRLWIAVIVSILSLLISNVAWLWYINQYDFESYSYEYLQDGKGLNIIGDNNGVYNGTESENNTEGTS